MNDTPKTTAGSRAANPDLDWSQIRETVLMLGLAVAQIEASMRDSEESVDVLANSFTSMFGRVNTIAEAARNLPDTEASLPLKEYIQGHCGVVSGQMQQAIMSFQFYDRLTQQLSHVCHSIDALAELITDNSRLYSPYEWVGLQQRIQSKYTTPGERQMFQMIMGGASVQEAIANYQQKKQERRQPNDDVELF